ncbi:MAG: hypothetical protein JWO49_2582 [Arthrobacter sp.]|nr:hypothetical protein [Arthrobacter sp.]
MVFLLILFAGLVVLAVTATIVSVLSDGRGHTPEVRSTPPWKAGDLPSEPYAASRS